MNTAGLTTEKMQAIAREFNLSETTFVERRAAAVEQAEGVRVRIFTTQEELNFAGHPTLGTASVLKMQAPETVQNGTVTLAENVGPVPVRFSGAGLYGEMTQRDPEFGAEMDPARSRAADRTQVQTTWTRQCRRRWFPREQPSPLSLCVRRRR